MCFFHCIAMSVILNYLTIMGTATCNIAPRPELTDSCNVLLVMNCAHSTDLRNLNTKRIDDAYAKLHRSLRRQMFRQAGRSTYGDPQRLTMADYTVSFTSIHDTTPIVQGPDIEQPEPERFIE
jgi:hypothetical protein